MQFHGRPARRKKRQTLINRDILTVHDSYKKILKNLCCFYTKKQEVNAYAVRQDTYKLNQRIRQMEFLSRYSIDTLAPLETYRQAKQGEIVQLTAERKSLYKTNPDSPRIQQVNTALKQLRQEERLCRKIAEHSIEVQQHLTEVRRDRAAQQQREQERARDLRSDITTR